METRKLSNTFKESWYNFSYMLSFKKKIIKHYITIRSFCTKNFSENSKKQNMFIGLQGFKKKA